MLIISSLSFCKSLLSRCCTATGSGTGDGTTTGEGAGDGTTIGDGDGDGMGVFGFSITLSTEVITSIFVGSSTFGFSGVGFIISLPLCLC